MVTSRGSRIGFSLVEIAVAVAILAALGIALFDVLGSGARYTAHASEDQLATVAAGRLMDRLVTAGFATLAAQAGAERPTALVDPGAAATPATTSARADDGLVFTGLYSIDLAQEGLLKLAVTVHWERPGNAGGPAGGRATLVRYVADPGAGLAVREPFGRPAP